MAELTEGLFQTIINTTTDAILVVDYQGIVRFANRAAVILFERSQEELLDTPFGFPVVTGEIIEIDIFRRNAAIRVAEMRVTEIEWDGLAASLASLRDITERKRAQDELQSLHNAVSYLFKSDSLLNLGHQIVEAIVREFKQANCSLSLLGEKHNHIQRLAYVGEYGAEVPLVIPLDGQSLIAECVRTGKQVYIADSRAEAHFTSNNSATRSELVIPLRTVHGTLGALDLQSTQINAFLESDQRVLNAFAERAAAAIETMQLYEKVNRNVIDLEWRVAQRTAELSRAKERVESILNHASDAIVIIHPNGTIQQANPAFYALLGGTPATMTGMTLISLFRTDQDAMAGAVQRALVDSQPVMIEVIGENRDGDDFIAEMAMAPIIRAESQKTSVICILRDFTERRHMEEELRQSLEREKELGELKSRFVSTASHEFRTPLATILATTETLSGYRDKMTSPEIDARLEKIRQQVLYLKNIMEDVLQLARIQAGRARANPLQGDLNRLCQDIIEEFESQEQHRGRIIYDCPTPSVWVIFDEHLMRKIINNLVSNALKYSPLESQIYVRLMQLVPYTIFEVEDAGIGIPAEDLKHLFEPFHRATNVNTISGTGLGLSIVQEAVKMHDGTVTVKSTIGAGTIFTVSIPLMTG